MQETSSSALAVGIACGMAHAAENSQSWQLKKALAGAVQDQRWRVGQLRAGDDGVRSVGLPSVPLRSALHTHLSAKSCEALHAAACFANLSTSRGAEGGTGLRMAQRHSLLDSS